MSEQKPDGKMVTVAKMIGVCITCVGIIYGIVTLFDAFAS